MANTSLTHVQGLIQEQIDGIRELLISKNKGYGNSALEPVRIFSKADPVEQIKVRIDDKLSRIARGDIKAIDEGLDEVIDDLIGYLVLLKIARQIDLKAKMNI